MRRSRRKSFYHDQGQHSAPQSVSVSARSGNCFQQVIARFPVAAPHALPEGHDVVPSRFRVRGNDKSQQIAWNNGMSGNPGMVVLVLAAWWAGQLNCSLAADFNCSLAAELNCSPAVESSPGGTAANSLGRKPQGLGTNLSARAQEGRHRHQPSVRCRPSGAQHRESTCYLGLTPQATRCRRSAAKHETTTKIATTTNADWVFLNGKVLTLDRQNRVVQAIAIRSNTVLDVGSDAEIRKHIGTKTKVVDLKGKTIVPGFIATHCHAIGVGLNSLQGPFIELTSIAEIQKWLREKAKLIPEGRWIRVPRADITRLKERRHPTPAELDAACSTHPVIFNAARKNVLNSLGFRMAGITDETKQVPGGIVVRDSAGKPRMIAGGDGHLRKFMPRPQFTNEEKLAALKKVLQKYNESGITSVFERATNIDGYRLYRALREKDELTVRSTLTIRQQFKTGEQVTAFTKKLGMKTGDGDDWIRIGPLKITVDGGIHWGTTRLREPYGPKRIKFYALEGIEDESYRGNLSYSVAQMTDIFEAGHRQGWQMCCHVTGDAGVDRVLDALEAVNGKFPITNRRFTLTHAYFPAIDAIARASKLGVCVDTQASLYYKDSDAIAEIYGADWAERFIGLGDWVRGGIPTAINGDHMIGLDPNRSMNAYNPFLMLHVAVTRKNRSGHVYGIHQRLTRIEALRCLTSTAAYLSFDEKKKGTLEPGKFADLVIFDRDYEKCPEEEILHMKVLTTMVDGKVVFQRNNTRSRQK